MSDDEELIDEIPKLSNTERLIHQPARLRIMSYLYVLKEADMVFIKNQTGLTWGNLSSHTSKLEDAELVKVEKKFQNKKPLTILKLTPKGLEAFKHYRNKISQMLRDSI